MQDYLKMSKFLVVWPPQQTADCTPPPARPSTTTTATTLPCDKGQQGNRFTFTQSTLKVFMTSQHGNKLDCFVNGQIFVNFFFNALFFLIDAVIAWK